MDNVLTISMIVFFLGFGVFITLMSLQLAKEFYDDYKARKRLKNKQ